MHSCHAFSAILIVADLCDTFFVELKNYGRTIIVEYTIKFRLRNETKGALRYQEVDDSGNDKNIGEGAVVGSLYLRKDQIDGTPNFVHCVLSTKE